MAKTHDLQSSERIVDRRLDSAPPHSTPSRERLRAGKELRHATPRSSQARWTPPADRPDPVALLQASDRTRLPELLPIRYGRMLQSPFAFLRGAAPIMARDLAVTPSTGVTVQLCGDAHLLNFGVYVTPERHLMFGLNDFDETLPGPWEWDVKRLAASFVVAGRENVCASDVCAEAAGAAARAYQSWIGTYARMSYLDAWYARVDDETILNTLPRAARDWGTPREAKDRPRRQMRQLSKLPTTINGQARIVDDPPLVTHASDERVGDQICALVERYIATLPDDRRALARRYTLVDVARKVVGVGSVGTRCYILLFNGRDQDDVLFLQIKEADASALEPYLAPSAYAQHGERVVQGQRLIQASSDTFLGWGCVADVHYYLRHLADIKGAVEMPSMTPTYLVAYARICGWALARAHARSGEAARISGYLGRNSAFERAITRFAVDYADQTERDHAALVAAVKAGRISAETGI